MTLDDYLSTVGAPSTVDLAATIGCNPDQLRQWRHGYSKRKPAPETCPGIERATAGVVTCDELRPDLLWARIKDKAWPWHKEGRPVLEVSKATA